MKRKLATIFYRRSVPLFSRLNANVKFQQLATTLRDVPNFPHREAMYEWLNCDCLGGVALNYLEFGVYNGSSLRTWCRLNSQRESRFFGFDSFEGLPENWTEDKPAGTFKTAFPSIQDERCRLVKGLFQESVYSFLDTFRPNGPLVVNIDCDLYSSALFCLAALDRWLTPGSIIMFDEFDDLDHEFSAFRDWTRAFYRKCDGLSHTGAYKQVAFRVR